VGQHLVTPTRNGGPGRPDPFADRSPQELRGAFADIIEVGMRRAGADDPATAAELARRLVSWMERRGMMIRLERPGGTYRMPGGS
jgi:hypothetical protein